MKIIKLSICIILVNSFLELNLNAQDSTFNKYNEIYLSTSSINLEGSGLNYKTQMKEDLFFRVGLLNINSDLTSYKPGTSASYPYSEIEVLLGFNIGLEKRKMINNIFSIFYGLDFITRTGYTYRIVKNAFIPKEMRTKYKYYIYPGIGFGSGILFNIKDAFFIGAEFNPQILFKYRKDQEYLYVSDDDAETIEYYNKYTDVSFDFDTESIRILFMYRWNKK